MPSDDVASPSGDGGTPSGADGRPPANVALRAVPYALPVAAGIAFLVWGVPELDRVVSTYYGNLPQLFGAMLILVVGSALFLYGIAGALSAVLRETTRG